jgi:hypothetical protein
MRKTKAPPKRGFFFYLEVPGWIVLFEALLEFGAKIPVLVFPREFVAPIAFPLVP